ncbi:MAG TPA: DNA topoisomerase IB [Bryobacteraceae bacterium]|jgi:DNA topoisomerase-1
MLSTPPSRSAAEAGLRYVTGFGPCIRRIRCGKSFRYVGPDGRPLQDSKRLARVRSLVIPPAWTDVWICPSANGHIQAVGWDARGRKQYRYHARYRQFRDQDKFAGMIAFGAMLAKIRSQVEKDLNRHGLPKEKVIAAVVRLLETTFIRVGNDEYARENDSFGLTTMRDRHVRIDGSRLFFKFRGKSRQDHTIAVADRRLARIVKACQDLPGYELFQYVNPAGQVCRIDSSDVNRYIRNVTGRDFTAKDFRTWAGTILAARELCAAGPCPSPSAGKKIMVEATKRVAQKLGNRPATCRKYYIHPAILEAYSDGSLFPLMERGEEYAITVIVAEYQQKLAKAA